MYALRLCIKGGGAKMGAPIRQDITKTLTALMSQAEDGIRTGAAAALGAILSSLPSEEKTDVVLSHILGNYLFSLCIHKLVLFELKNA